MPAPVRARVLLSLSLLAGLFGVRCNEAPRATAPQRIPSARRAPAPPEYPFRDPRRPALERAKDLVARLTIAEKVAQMSHDAPGIERLGIESYNWWNEALHGVARSGRATVFPQAIALAATFDPKLVKHVASAIADEARAKFNRAEQLGNRGRYAGLTFWSPNINIFRDPRWGRGQETYGEDPYLTSRIGVAFVQGLQGDHPKYLKAAAAAKHFAVHSGPEALRHEFDATPSKKDLYETYLPAFEALVKEGKVEAVMTAYNRLYGEPCSTSKFLIEDTLRNSWHFQGHVVSDCWALLDVHAHHRVTRGPVQSAARALAAGLDLDCGDTYPALGEALAEGLVDERAIDRAVTRLFVTRIKLGLFDPKGSVPFDLLPPELVGSKQHRRLAQSAAEKSIVLLKNEDKTLPLDPKLKRLMLLGPYVTDSDVLLGNYFGGAAALTTLYEGVMQVVDEGTSVEYKPAFLAMRPNPNPMDWVTREAHQHDAIIVTLGLSGRVEGEEGAAIESEHKGDREQIGLPQNQVDFLKKLRAAGDKKIVVVLFGGSPFAMDDVHDLADAILLAWYPGEEGGRALADLLFGQKSPSGRLPLSFPMRAQKLPAFDDYAMQGRSYRYAEAEPLYPFGFGLSYATVLYESLKLDHESVRAGQEQVAIVRIRNKSSREIEEVVQLYLTDEVASTRTPRSTLVAFQRVALGPRQTLSVELGIPADAMRLVTDSGQKIFEPGRFIVHAGGAAPSTRSAALGAQAPLTASFELLK